MRNTITLIMSNNKEWIPVSRQQLGHRIKGRSVYAAKFKAKKYFDFDDIKKFAEKTRLKLAQSQTVQTMQITYQYSDQSTRGNRMLSIDEELDLEDYRNRYGGDDSDIIGFTILLS